MLKNVILNPMVRSLVNTIQEDYEGVLLFGSEKGSFHDLNENSWRFAESPNNKLHFRFCIGRDSEHLW